MNNDLINKALIYIKDFFKDEYGGHDYYHSLRVYNLAKTLANKIECDKELVYLSALLHDVDDYKLVDNNQEKFMNAKTFLKNNNYPKERIDMICHIIFQISFKAKDTLTPDTIEGKIVQDADRLDAIGAIGIARTFDFGGNNNIPIYIPEIRVNLNMSAEEYSKYAKTTINHFYEKLLLLKDMMNTEEAKQIAEHRHKYMEEYLDEFYKEWDGIL